MDNARIGRILEDLRSSRRLDAWAEFLEACSPLILRVVQSFQRDADAIADCYLYACEQLCRNDFRRLQKFQPGGPAGFSTWLQVVVHNLCLDWRRHKFGRTRPFGSVNGLPELNQEVFRYLFEERRSASEALGTLRAKFPAITLQQIEDAQADILRNLKPRQRFLLSLRQAVAGPADDLASDSREAALEQVPDGRPSPEDLVVLEERRAGLAASVARLEDAERFLIRLRFEQGLTLQQVARTAGLADAQTADRRIKLILDRLRRELS